MASKTPYLPPRWVITTAWRIHRALYRWTGGRLGLRQPKPDTYGLGQLTTIGRRTGKPRSVMIGYYEDDGAFVTMAMNGWAPAEPAWWLNLQAEPRAKLILSDRSIDVIGRAATGQERERLWQRWCELDKDLEGWAARRPSETAVVVLDDAAISHK